MSEPLTKARATTRHSRHPSEPFAWLRYPWVGPIRFLYFMTMSPIFYKAKYLIPQSPTSTMYLSEVPRRVIYRPMVHTRQSQRTLESVDSYGNTSKVLIESYSA